MEKVTVGGGSGLHIDRCARCGGVWLEHGEVQQMRRASKPALLLGKEPRQTIFQMRCHDCHAPMERAASACPGCGWNNRLDCPACDRQMQTEEHAGLRLDVCRECKGVWFDRHELKAIWGPNFDHSLQNRNRSGSGAVAAAADGAGDVLFTTLFFAPEFLYLGASAAANLASASARAIPSLPEAAAAAPGAAATIFEAAGEAAGSVFEVIVDIVSGIFDSF